jgi:tetratricopeptide (TPR) repeat protein
MLGQTAKSEDAYREALKLDPKYMPALQNLGRLLYKEKKYKKCIGVFDRVLAKDVTDIDAIRFQAGCYHALNQTFMAIQKFLEVHRLDTDDSETIMTLARLYKNSWEYSKAIPFYEKLISIEPDEPGHYLSLSMAHYKLGEHEQALDILQKGHKHMPYDYDIASRLGDMLFVNKDYSQAVSIYRKVLLIKPESKEIPVCLAKIYSLQKQFSEAEKILGNLLERDSSNLKAYEHLAPVYLAQNKLNKAAACYEKIVMLKNKPLEEYLLLGSIFLYSNKPKEAIQFYEKALEIDSNDIRSYNGLGAAYSILSRWDQAIGCYKKALILNAKDEEAKQGLLYALKRDIKGIQVNIDALSGASPPACRRGDTGVFIQD